MQFKLEDSFSEQRGYMISLPGMGVIAPRQSKVTSRGHRFPLKPHLWEYEAGHSWFLKQMLSELWGKKCTKEEPYGNEERRTLCSYNCPLSHGEGKMPVRKATVKPRETLNLDNGFTKHGWGWKGQEWIPPEHFILRYWFGKVDTWYYLRSHVMFKVTSVMQTLKKDNQGYLSAWGFLCYLYQLCVRQTNFQKNLARSTPTWICISRCNIVIYTSDKLLE